LTIGFQCGAKNGYGLRLRTTNLADSDSETKNCFGLDLILYSDNLCVVIDLGMRSAKDKPLTRKEREEKRKRRKEKRLKK